MRHLTNILWLSLKELKTLWRDFVLVLLVVYAFGPGMYIESSARNEFIRNTVVTFVDEDKSALSASLRTALYPPYFLEPKVSEATEIDRMMDWGDIGFAVVIPRGLEADVRAGRQPEIQINIDATNTFQAGVGTGYLTAIINDEIKRFAARKDVSELAPVELVMRRAFNPTGNIVWLSAISELLNQLSMLTIVLTGAALIREREHGTIEHLMVMPVNAFEIALAKVFANGLVIFVSFVFSMYVVVQGLLDIPFAGSEALLLAGTGLYIFAAAAIGILLGILARSMAQFALLILIVVMPMILLSGGMSPIESQPIWLKPITLMLPSRHYMDFAEAIVYRGAGFDIVWPEFLWAFLLGLVFLITSLLLFRRSVTRG